MLSINISELIWTVICFFLLYFLLKKLFYGPLVSFMDAREEKISSGLSKLEETDRAVAQSNAEAEALLSESRTRGQKLIDTARADFESRHDELLKKAGDDSEKAIAAMGDRLEKLRSKAERDIASDEDDYARLLLEKLLVNR